MNEKLLSTSATGTKVKVSVRSPWSALPANLSDSRFLRSWIVYDSSLDEDDEKGRIRWNVLLGMALAFGISVGFWAGVAVVVERVWK